MSTLTGELLTQTTPLNPFGFVQSLDTSDSCALDQADTPVPFTNLPDISGQPSHLQAGYHADYLLEEGTAADIGSETPGPDANWASVTGTIPEPTSWFDAPFGKNWCLGVGSVAILPSFTLADAPIDVPIGEHYPTDDPLNPLRSF